MKTSIALLLSVVFLSPLFVYAEIPFGVTPKEITVTGSIEPNMDQINLLGYIRSSGKITEDYVYATGNRIGVKIGAIEYTIRFWNVGKMGGTSGYLFWKKDYGKAVMYLDYVVSDNGYVIGDEQDGSKLGLPNSWPMEPATGEPEIRQASCVMEFSGGPTGTFEGVCNNGAKISGRVGAGSFLVFDEITQPTDPNDLELALRVIPGNDLKMNGEFGDWKFDESGLVDCGARFNSISGQVEVRHEQEERGWKSAKLETIMYVDDHVKTSEESSAILSFADMQTFVMKEETEIALNAPPGKDSKIKMVAGKVMANIRKMMKDGSMEIDMSQAVAGIKGTRFILTETGTESTIEVTEGTVAFRSKANGQTEMVSAGEAVTASPSGLSAKSTFNAEEADRALVEATTALPVRDPVAPSANEASDDSSTGSMGKVTLGVLALIGIFGIAWRMKRKGRVETEATEP